MDLGRIGAICGHWWITEVGQLAFDGYFRVMKAHQANMLNALVLIAMGLWGYFGADAADRSMTALIAPAFGAILLFCTPGVKSENKAVAHVAVLLTFLLLVMLVAMPLPARLNADPADPMGLFRVIAMIATSALAMFFFIKSFRDARKAREAAEV